MKHTAIVFAIFLLVLMSLLIVRWPFSQARVTESLETTFPAKVSYAKFHSTYFPHPGCVAEGVAFYWLGSKPDAPPIVTVQNFRVKGHYWDLLLRRGYISHILLKGFRVNVPPFGTEHERFNWRETPSHLRVGEINADGAVVTFARKGDEPPLIFDVHTARLTSVTRHQPFSYAITFQNPLPPGEIRARGEFGPWNSQDPGSTQISGVSSFWNGDLGVFHGIAGTLSSHDQYQGPLHRINTSGDIDIPNFSVTRSGHSVHLKSSFRAYVDGVKGDVFLERVSTQFLKTSVLAQGKIATPSGKHGKTAEIDVFVTEGRIQDVLRLFVSESTPPLRGVTSFRARVTIPPGKAPFLEKIARTGDLGIHDGEYTKPSTQEEVTSFSERARGIDPSDKKNQREEKDKHDGDINDVVPPAGTNDSKKGNDKPERHDSAGGSKEKAEDQKDDEYRIVSNLSGHVDLRHDIATFSDISFTVPGALAQMQGTYHLQTHVVNLHGTLKTDAEFSHMASGIKSVLLKPLNMFFKKKHAGAVIPAHLTGTYENPRPGIDLVSKSPPSHTGASEP